MMLGFLLVRAGVAVVVLEKHADFFRDFPRRHGSPFDARIDLRVGLDR
jgi:hypothetical protein